MNVQEIPVSQINNDPAFNVCRSNLSPADCEDIAQSIQVHGLQIPVLVRPVEGLKGYELVSGFRRFMAVSVNLGLETIPAFVREMSAEEARILNVIENLQRVDLTFWNQCCAIKAAFSDLGKQTDIANALGKSRQWVKKRVQLWELPEQLLIQIEAGLISPSEVDIIIQQDEKDRLRAAAKLRAGKAAGESIRDLQRDLTGRQNSRSKTQVKKVMTVCMEQGHEAAVHALRYATGEISDTLLYELLEKVKNPF